VVSELRRERDRERKSRTQNMLIDAAVRVFVNKGYHNTLISDVVTEAGVGQGTFYRYFVGKREVFEAIFDRFAVELLGQFSEMSAELPADLNQYRDASLNAVKRLARLLEENKEMTVLFLREANAVDGEFRDKLAGFYTSFAQLAQFFLEHAIANGFARPCRADVVAQSLVGIALQMITAWWHGSFADLTPEELGEEIVNFAFYGFGRTN